MESGFADGRVPFRPEFGKIYKNRCGSDFMCIDKLATQCKARMKRVSDGYSIYAHGFIKYPDGTIEWDYSTNEGWEE